MQLTNQQQQYIQAREINGTPEQRLFCMILRTVLSALNNCDKPAGIASGHDFLAEIKRFLNQ